MTLSEKRRHQRIAGRLQVLAKVLKDDHLSSSKVISGYAVNVSKTGIRFLSADPVPEASELRLNITLGNPYHLATRIGRVIWVRETDHDSDLYEIGVLFHRPDDPDFVIWNQFLDNRLKAPA